MRIIASGLIAALLASCAATKLVTTPVRVAAKVAGTGVKAVGAAARVVN